MLIQQPSLSLNACDSNSGYAERSNGNQAMTPAIKMLIGDWYVDELGILTREITARD
jgi:hypothetical protein